MKHEHLLLLLVLGNFIFGAIFCFSCVDGEDGRDGRDGEVIGAADDDHDGGPDDETEEPDDDGGGDDDQTGDDDGTGDDDDGLTADDLPYADDCPDLADCVVAACQATPDPDSYALLKCTLQNCSDPYAACFGPYGDEACVTVLKCLEACLPADCLQDCMAPASYESLLQFADAGICVEENCPEALADPLHNIGCFLGPCNAPIAVCCGGSVLGCM
ncbi:MAG: hypothetical protein GX444_00680 [Myxococcales bacterium]|nr:hypothetical protein [Myxococcales bacterium]